MKPSIGGLLEFNIRGCRWLELPAATPHWLAILNAETQTPNRQVRGFPLCNERGERGVLLHCSNTLRRARPEGMTGATMFDGFRRVD